MAILTMKKLENACLYALAEDSETVGYGLIKKSLGRTWASLILLEENFPGWGLWQTDCDGTEKQSLCYGITNRRQLRFA